MDSGNCLASVGTKSRLNSEVLLQGMDRMGYAALNLGVFEFVHGPEFLAEWRNKIRFPIISSNLALSEGTAPLAEKYVIEEVNGLKIGLLGVVSPELFDRVYLGRFSKYFQPTAPEAALASLVPELRSNVDIVILLASCEFDDVKRMVREIPGIDLAIVSSVKKPEMEWLEKPSGPAVVTLVYQGEELGLMDISLASSSRIQRMQNGVIVLDQSVAAEETTQALIDKSLGHQLRTDKGSKDCTGSVTVQTPIPEDEIKNLLKLKPEEYIEKLRKEGAQRGVNR